MTRRSPLLIPESDADRGDARLGPDRCGGSLGNTSSPAARLARELESVEASLREAERAALGYRAGTRLSTAESCGDGDVASRRAELERRERELDARERAIEQHRRSLQEAQERVLRLKESLKRAIRRFRSESMRRHDELDVRERRIADAHHDLIDARREVAREEIRLKATFRKSLALSASD